MTQDIRWQQRLNNYEKALSQLTDAVELSRQRELSDLEKQGLIQAFEFTHELAWNTLKDFLEYKGQSGIYGSRDATRKAFELELIEDGDSWMQMIQNRNRSSHTYNQKVMQEIIEAILTAYHQQFLLLADKLNKMKDA
jgi:nucleotidyltransferase substrate binding protein (TIGR01987 family)